MWGVEMYGMGWEPLADEFVSEADAESFMESFAAHRSQGTLGLRVVETDQDTVTVWVMPHDDPEVVWVVNDEGDMQGNYRDMLAEDHETGSFQDYLDSWTELEMPRTVFMSDRPVVIAWVEDNVNT